MVAILESPRSGQRWLPIPVVEYRDKGIVGWEVYKTGGRVEGGNLFRLGLWYEYYRGLVEGLATCSWRAAAASGYRKTRYRTWMIMCEGGGKRLARLVVDDYILGWLGEEEA